MGVKAISACVSVALTFACTNSPAVAASYIRFSPGPGDTTRVSTPWGVFIAEETADGVWVGTEEEWTDAVAKSVFERDGDKQVHMINGVRTERHYVPRGDEVSVGGGRLYDIESFVLFNQKPDLALKRPPRPAGSEYWGLVWQPQLRQPVTVRLVVDGISVAPNDCRTDDGFRSCEFTVTRASMARPVTAYFLLAGQKPAALRMASMAQKAYQDIETSLRGSPGIDPSPDQKSDLVNLHRVDSAVPEQAP